MPEFLMLGRGLESELPAPGIETRLYVASDTGRIFQDQGSAWDPSVIAFQGAWSGTFAYKRNDLATYGGSLWRSNRPNIGITPVEGADWTILAAKGAQGDQGPSGFAGIVLERGDSIAVNGATAIDFSTAFNVSESPAGEGNVSPNFGNASGTIAEGNDSRLSNARVPTAHKSTHEPGGSDALAVDADIGIGSLRTLGTGSQQALPGNHNSTTNTRTPTDGTVTLPKAATDISLPFICTAATRPASPKEGQVIYQTDTDTLLVNKGSSGTPNWQPVGATLQMIVGIYADATTYTDQPSAEEELLNGTARRHRADLTNYSQVRSTLAVHVAGASGAYCRVQFSTDLSTWQNFGTTTETNMSIGTTGFRTTSWLSLPAAAKADVYFRAVVGGGNAVADPVFGAIDLHVRA